LASSETSSEKKLRIKIYSHSFSKKFFVLVFIVDYFSIKFCE